MAEDRQTDPRWAALQAVLDSGVLGDQSRLRTLLTYLVTEEVEGRGDRIKAYSIATEALGRGAGFNPSTDSIVRVEVARLRQALALYSASAGPDVSTIIEVPKGGYRPAFLTVAGRPAPPAEPAPSPEVPEARPESPKATRRLWPWLLAAGIALVLFGGLAGAYVMSRTDQVQRVAGERPQRLRVVLRPGADSAPVTNALLASQRVVSAFSQVGVVTEALDSPIPAAAWPETYRLTVQPEGESGVRLELVHAASGDLVSSHSFGGEVAARPSRDPMLQLSPLETYVATLVVREGGIEADYRARGDMVPALECITMVNDYFLEETDAGHAAAVDCIEARIAAGEERADLYTGLAYMFREEYTDQRNPRPGDPLARALAAANRATQLDPYGGINYYAQATVLNAMHQDDNFMRVGRTAIQLNPYSPEIAGGLGARMAQLGHPGEALVYLRRAEEVKPGEANWRNYAFFLAHLQRGEAREAAARADMLIGSRNPLYVAALVVARHLEGREADAQKAYRILEELSEGPPHMADAYDRRNYAPELSGLLLDALGDVVASL